MGMAKENQFHVLAVDDSIIDRMLIERLLKTSSFQGNFLFFLSMSFLF
jgi:two-component response regulator (ARR-A family)